MQGKPHFNGETHFQKRYPVSLKARRTPAAGMGTMPAPRSSPSPGQSKKMDQMGRADITRPI